jgi:hypothetical protein
MTPEPLTIHTTTAEVEAELREYAAMVRERNVLRSLLRQLINDLPRKRDWLDPALERQARALAAGEKGEG